ncbi:deoxycytidylate deaminase [Myriangium duriaei CBS 260.36]|uniref:Deoxycytidylate deaminase n=1 Tax=Myriangium duriaei CBS 260.36 TaxID=1168546 RepID=A0A9P4J5G0_9PEZI|nr:deoxycytidylate deaminase [Myriangium duriaei CBS 260.36]
MLIGICGGLCAGKASVAQYLVERHKFTPLAISRPASTPSVEKSASDHSVMTDRSASSATKVFSDAEGLLDYVTQNWTEHFVTTCLWSQHVLNVLLRRPFFVLISVDAPISVRWARFKARCVLHGEAPPSLEQFVLRDDSHMYDGQYGLAGLPSQARVKLINSTSSLQDLFQQLDGLRLTDEDRIRPSWDQYFMTLASLAARRSNCMRRQVGCVLVRGKRVISTGYNGTPRNITNCNQGGCPRCNGASTGGTALSTCRCVHAEENALLEAGRERVGEDATIYCNTCPCLTCSIKIVQVGIREVVYSRSYYMDAEIATLFKEAGVRLRQFLPPAEGLISLNDSTETRNGHV